MYVYVFYVSLNAWRSVRVEFMYVNILFIVLYVYKYVCMYCP